VSRDVEGKREKWDHPDLREPKLESPVRTAFTDTMVKRESQAFPVEAAATVLREAKESTVLPVCLELVVNPVTWVCLESQVFLDV